MHTEKCQNSLTRSATCSNNINLITKEFKRHGNRIKPFYQHSRIPKHRPCKFTTNFVTSNYHKLKKKNKELGGHL